MKKEMETATYKFKESEWGGEGDLFRNYSENEWEGPNDPRSINCNKLRVNYPELSGWSEQTLYNAWGWFSQDYYQLSWSEIDKREAIFLGYLYAVENKILPVGKWYGLDKEATDSLSRIGL